MSREAGRPRFYELETETTEDGGAIFGQSPMIIHYRRGYLVWRSALALLVAGLGIWIACTADETYAFTLAAIFFATWALKCLLRNFLILLRPSRFNATINEGGISLREPFKSAEVAWKYVTAMKILRGLRETQRIRLDLDESRPVAARIGWRHKKLDIIPRPFDIEPARLTEIVRSHIDEARAEACQSPIEVSSEFNMQPSPGFLLGFMALMSFSRMSDREHAAQKRKLVSAIGAPLNTRIHPIDKSQIDRLIKLYPKDPRVRIAFAEKLIDEDHISEAAHELRAVHEDGDTLKAFDYRGQLEAEIRAVMAEALMKRSRTQDAKTIVGPVCAKLATPVFEKMRKLDLCHYSRV